MKIETAVTIAFILGCVFGYGYQWWMMAFHDAKLHNRIAKEEYDRWAEAYKEWDQRGRIGCPPFPWPPCEWVAK